MGHVGAGAGMPPREARDLVPDRQPHQVVPGRMERDLVDAHPVAVEGPELGRMPVGQIGLLEGLRRARRPAEYGQPVRGPAPALALDPVAERRIVPPEVLVAEVGRHVGDFVGGQGGERPERDHGGSFLVRGRGGRKGGRRTPPRVVPRASRPGVSNMPATGIKEAVHRSTQVRGGDSRQARISQARPGNAGVPPASSPGRFTSIRCGRDARVRRTRRSQGSRASAAVG